MSCHKNVMTIHYIRLGYESCNVMKASVKMLCFLLKKSLTSVAMKYSLKVMINRILPYEIFLNWTKARFINFI